MKRFYWTVQKTNAALLVARDELTDEQIAREVGFTRNTLATWKTCKAFQDRVHKHLNEFKDRARRKGIAVVEYRSTALQDRWERMNKVMRERGAAAVMAEVPGGTTGLLVHNVKSVGAGMLAERVDLYELDAALLKELREHEKQAAQELGQWADKVEHSGPDGSAISIETRQPFDYAGFQRAIGSARSGDIASLRLPEAHCD